MYRKKLGDDNEERLESLVKGYEAQILTRMKEDYDRTTTSSDRIADKIAAFGGSWGFIGSFGFFLVLWMAWNVLSLTGGMHFDQPPFILLNLILSFTAAFQAPIILMSQNRQAARDKREAMVDFAINWYAQREIDDMQGDLHRTEAAVELLTRMAKDLRRDVVLMKEHLGVTEEPGAPRG